MRGLRLTTLVAPLAVAIAVAAGPARAMQDAGPCRQDALALCPSVTPGPGAFHYCLGTLCPDLGQGPGGFAACLQKFADKLSPACQEHLSDVQAKIAAWKQEFQQACQADVQTFCADVGTDRRDIGRCLHEHKDELSQSCSDLLSKHGGRHACKGPTPAAD